MFDLLTAGTDSSHYIINPINKELKIFLLFDTVHLLKSIRKNWLNVKKKKTGPKLYPFYHSLAMILKVKQCAEPHFQTLKLYTK